MPDRIDTPFTGEHFARWCLTMAEKRSPYWYGCCVYKAGSGLLRRKSAQYPSHYGPGRAARYNQDIAARQVVADCVGACKGYAWTGGGLGTVEAIGTDRRISSRYGAHGCPDKGANSLFSWAKKKGAAWGPIGTLPEVPGLALYRPGHMGYYVGDGWAVEWRGFRDGCVRTAVPGRGWTHWFALPFIDYGTAAPPAAGTPAVSLGSRLLRRGASGADVRALQALLNRLDASLTVDGRFGRRTEAAVKAFQKAAGLRQDGQYGPQTHAALTAAAAEKA